MIDFAIRFSFSTTDERFADEQADTILSRIPSCLATAKSPDLQNGHFLSAS